MEDLDEEYEEGGDDEEEEEEVDDEDEDWSFRNSTSASRRRTSKTSTRDECPACRKLRGLYPGTGRPMHTCSWWQEENRAGYTHRDGSDEDGASDSQRVRDLRRQFLAWFDLQRPQAISSEGMATHWDRPAGLQYLREWFKTFPNTRQNADGGGLGGPGRAAVSPRELDVRMDLARTYEKHGIPRSLFRSKAQFTWKARFTHIVDCHPECFHVDGSMPQGPFFSPITREDLDDERLYKLILKRIESSMNADRDAFLLGNRTPSQPSGRYICVADFIKLHNSTGGFCKCGAYLYLHKTDIVAPSGTYTAKEFSWHVNHGKGMIQRSDNNHIHLIGNVSDRLVCADCQVATIQNDGGGASYIRPTLDAESD